MDRSKLSSYVLLENMRRKGANVWSEETDLFLAKVKGISFAEARRLKMEWVKEYDVIESYLEDQSLISPRNDGWKLQSEKTIVEKYKTSKYMAIKRRNRYPSVKPFKMSDRMLQKLNQASNASKKALKSQESDDFERQK